MATKQSSDIISILEVYFMKLPPLSKEVKAKIASILPWLALIFGILGVVVSFLATIGLLGLAPMMAVGGGVGFTVNALIGVLLGLISSGLLLAAYPGVKANKYQGWKLLFWSELVGAVSSLLSLALPGILIAALGLYILFQVKSLYK